MAFPRRMYDLAKNYHGSAGNSVPRNERNNRRLNLFEEFHFGDEVLVNTDDTCYMTRTNFEKVKEVFEKSTIRFTEDIEERSDSWSVVIWQFIRIEFDDELELMNVWGKQLNPLARRKVYVLINLLKHLCEGKVTWNREKAVRDGLRCFFKETKKYREEMMAKEWEGFAIPLCRPIDRNSEPSPTNFVVWKEEIKNELSSFYSSLPRKRNRSP